jgi:hypothetical protein
MLCDCASEACVEMRVKSVRQHDHCWRDIDTNHARTALCRLCG